MKRPFLQRSSLCALIIFILFSIIWSIRTASYIPFPSEDKPKLYGNQTGTDLHLLFCKALSAAEHSIFLEMYGLTDPDILQLLHYKRAQGKQITIRSDRRGSPKLKKNVHVELYRGPGLMHRKLLIIDEKMVFIGSANCTTTSLKSHDNLVLGIEDRALASFCQRNSPPWVYSVPSLRVWKLPEGGKEALQSSYALIHSAQNTIRVAMFTFTHMGLANALVAAKQRGVKVEVALDHYTKNGSSKKVAAFLAGHGIPIYESRGWQLLHHKWAVIDEKVLIGGSANWTESAFKKNKELLFILPLSKELRYEMRNVWQEIRLTGNAA